MQNYALACVAEGHYGPDMSFFLCKLIPPRPTFARDMTQAEAKLMQEHVAYSGKTQRTGGLW